MRETAEMSSPRPPEPRPDDRRRALLADEMKELRAELAALKERVTTLETKGA